MFVLMKHHKDLVLVYCCKIADDLVNEKDVTW